MSKIYIIAGRHDENLLALYQECYNIGIECVPAYIFSWEQFEGFKEEVTEEDYVMLIHTSGDSGSLHRIAAETKCKKFLNKEAFLNIENLTKKEQQNIVSTTYPEIVIPTWTLNSIPDDVIYPIIQKPDFASEGYGIKIGNNKEDLDTNSTYIFQPFIKNDGDYRVIVINGVAVSCIKRLGNKDNITNNIATGSFAINVIDDVVRNKVCEVAIKASKCLNFDYVGIDIIYDLESDKYLFLESNERATFETSQILSGTNIAKCIINELIR